MDERTLHRALLDPETYPEKTATVDFRETHVSRLYLTDRFVYKIKKPVDFGFLDFTALERRRFFCEEEVRLNRRYCADTYLGVVELRLRGGRLFIGGAGELVEYAVKMKRLPEDRMLDRLLEGGAPLPPGLPETLARKIARMHRDSEVCSGEKDGSNLETVRGNWRENFEQTAPFAGRTVSEKALTLLEAYVGHFLERRAALLERRQEEGFVREGHGDLHAEHICLTDPICIYDCIEFNRRFRVADTVADLAFLLMDLDFRNRRELSAAILAAYGRAMGNDPDRDLLLPFYKVYRAFVRGKVASFLCGEEEAQAATRREAAQRARRYFNLALGYLCPPGLVITCGLMGTGKTTVGRALAEALGGEFLRSDTLRKELAGVEAAVRLEAPYGRGAYGPLATRRTYEELLARTSKALAAGRSVVADASFIRREDRERFRTAAEGAGVPFHILVVQCDEAEALARLDRRQREGGDASDGRRELFSRQAADFESPAGGAAVIPIDTGRGIRDNVDLILCELIERGEPCP